MQGFQSVANDFFVLLVLPGADDKNAGIDPGPLDDECQEFDVLVL